MGFTRALFILFVYFADYRATGRSTKVGLLIQENECCNFQTLANSVGAISIALDALKADQIWAHNISFEWKNTVDVNDGVRNVVELVRDRNIDLILGSPSSAPTIPAAHLTAGWNFPHISWGAASFDLADKSVYTTFIRTRGSLADWGYCIVKLFAKYNWTHFGMLFRTNRICKYCGESLINLADSKNLTITTVERIETLMLSDKKIDGYFGRLKRTSRVIYFCVPLTDLRRYLIRACTMGMCNGQYVFIFPEYNPLSSDIVYGGDEFDELAERGFKQLMLITLASWIGDNKEQFERFQKTVIERMVEPPWNIHDPKLLNEAVSSTAVALHNAVYFYGMWLNYTEAFDLDPKNGTGMMEFSKGLSFEGPSGTIIFGDNGDAFPILWVWQFRGDTLAPLVVMDAGYDLMQDINFIWHTKDGAPPVDIPKCGFNNEFCPSTVHSTDTLTTAFKVTVGTLVSVTLIAMGLLFIFVRKRILDRQARVAWIIDPNAVVRLELKSASASETSDMTLRSKATRDTAQGASCIKIAVYNANTVVIKQLKNSVILTASERNDLEKMKEMLHLNINPFFGACFDPPTPMALFQYCAKGSLQDVLENPDLNIDNSLLGSLVSDLVQGIRYIHESPLESHGRLKSPNCLIDTRWTLKITDFFMSKFAHKTDDNVNIYKGMLWTAPEILEEPRLYPKGSQQADIYSFGIILHEVVFRMGVFAGREHLTPEVIVTIVRNREAIPMRPKTFTTQIESTKKLVELMEQCWADDPTKRPSIRKIKSRVSKELLVSDDGYSKTVEKRLMNYAENLEGIVHKRTQLLLEEKRKTETLLYQMLPKSVADKLKAGCPVPPEEYESATVYFSDIVGFTAIAGESTPLEIVDFLNQLYSRLDAVINKYDAYKVETIGDAYMIVSGVPVKNGDIHTEIIANVSLELMQAIQQFRIKHLPTKVLQQRSGFHTGPCCAGVIGLTMPKYSLFGDTINVASRMETTGEAQKIQISHQVYSVLSVQRQYICDFRGELNIKGKGKMKTYWLLRKEAAPIPPIENMDSSQQSLTVTHC